MRLDFHDLLFTIEMPAEPVKREHRAVDVSVAESRVNMVAYPIGRGEQEGTCGAIVIKGCEPLLDDFPLYLDWLCTKPFRSSYLPIALHFALIMKLPPGGMCLWECLLEQQHSSQVQSEFASTYGALPRVPVPLFVYRLSDRHLERYSDLLQRRLPPHAFERVEPKLSGGLGVEVYYYPSIPVRAFDLSDAVIRRTFAPVLDDESLGATFEAWAKLLGRLLHLGYMPYAPWNAGMGACVDPGNACIDGGFCDLLTLVPFSSIQTEVLFRNSLVGTIQLLAYSVAVLCGSILPGKISWSRELPPELWVTYVKDLLATYVLSERTAMRTADPRLLKFFERSTVRDLLDSQVDVQGATKAYTGARLEQESDATV